MDELSDAGVPDDESVTTHIIGKADEAVTSTHHTESFLTMEKREVKLGVFIEIFVVVPMQCVVLFSLFVGDSIYLPGGLRVEAEKEVFGGGMAEMVGNERWVLD